MVKAPSTCRSSGVCVAVVMLGLTLVHGVPATLFAANCAVTTVGLTPLDDLGAGTYQGEPGGLYAGGANERPPAHDAAGRARAAAIAPINGAIVLISIGMSNTTQEFSRFVPLAMNHPARNPALRVVDCAAGGQHAAIAADPNTPYWNVVRQRLLQAGVDSSQVRAAWIKEAIPNPALPFPADAIELQGYFRAIAQNLHDKFPNLDLAYFSSRIYAGYATGVSTLNPEPWAYQSGFAVKWLIDDQVTGDPGLNYDPHAGPVEVPWLAWGPYLWADGLVPRSDGLIWRCSDFQNDGTHPSVGGATKVAQMLLDFFTTDATATPWFLRPAAAIEDPGIVAGATEFRLLRARPNPFTERVSIPLSGSIARVAARVLDPTGRLVARIRCEAAAGGGPAALVWDGRNTSGSRVPAGAYWIEARSDGEVARARLTRVE